MSFNSIHKFLIDDRLWIFLSFILLGWYLSPLFMHAFFVPIFDNLDSNVVWYKILAHSGKIFSPNSSIIPNMMHGLPRLSYGGEFNIELWLYYFFSPKTAYIINEVLIHMIAFISMFVFLKKYVVSYSENYRNVPIFVGSLYFALLPFWSGAGAGIALLPLVTYALLNIKNKTSGIWEWVLLVLLPLYSSFVIVYFFYIILACLYLFLDSINNKKINWKFFIAIALMTIIFLLANYRLVYAMLFDSGFISHRTEFSVFFQENLWETYRLSLVKFLQGHPPHADPLQQPYVLPIIILGLFFHISKRRYTLIESALIWFIIILSFIVDIWNILLINKFTLPAICLFSFFAWMRSKGEAKIFPALMLLIIFLSLFSSFFEYKGFLFITKYIPLLKSFNMVRFIFIEPFIYAVLLTYAVVSFFEKLEFSSVMVFLFLIFQVTYSFDKSFYKYKYQHGYASFEEYYASQTFMSLKKKFPKLWAQDTHVVCYGFEPAVALYNDLHTVDGYSVNYPVEYKHKFLKVLANYNTPVTLRTWGSKLYITTIPNTFDTYQMAKGVVVRNIRLSEKALCELDTDYLISVFKLAHPENKKMRYVTKVRNPDINSWDLYVYKLDCNNTK